MDAITHAVGSSGNLNRSRARRLAAAGTLSLATMVGAAAPQAADADNTLSCKGRQPTVLAIPGVRTVGTAGSDVIVGLPLIKDTLDGRGGRDVLCGLDRRDFLYGAADNDELRGNQKGDRLFGDAGDDFVRGGRGGDRLNGGPGFDRCVGGPGGGDIAIGCERVVSASSR